MRSLIMPVLLALVASVACGSETIDDLRRRETRPLCKEEGLEWCGDGAFILRCSCSGTDCRGFLVDCGAYTPCPSAHLCVDGSCHC